MSTRIAKKAPSKRYDAFISHASEDKDSFVRPLAEFLDQAGLVVWYDEFTLAAGDSLSRSIDKGLARSKFGIVVLSKAFFQKRWPEYELQGLVTKEMDSRGKVIIPIWLNIKKADIVKYSPTLADKIAIDGSKNAVAEIAWKIIGITRPDLLSRFHQRLALIRDLPNATLESVDLESITRAPYQYAGLSRALISRVRLIRAALLDVYPLSMGAWVDGFRRDTNPDMEIAVWEKIASTYMEHVYAYKPEDRQSVFSDIFCIIGAGDKPKNSAEPSYRDIVLRCRQLGPIEGREVQKYPVVGDIKDDNEAATPEQINGMIADQIPDKTIEKLRFNELNANFHRGRVTTIDISEIQSESVRRLIEQAGVIFGRDRNSGNVAVFYGKDTFERFAQRKDESVVFPRPVLIVSYCNDREDLEYLFAAVQHLKGACCYEGSPSAQKGRSRVRGRKKTSKAAGAK